MALWRGGPYWKAHLEAEGQLDGGLRAKPPEKRPLGPFGDPSCYPHWGAIGTICSIRYQEPVVKCIDKRSVLKRARAAQNEAHSKLCAFCARNDCSDLCWPVELPIPPNVVLHKASQGFIFLQFL